MKIEVKLDNFMKLQSFFLRKEKYFRAVRRLFTQLDENSDGGGMAGWNQWEKPFVKQNLSKNGSWDWDLDFFIFPQIFLDWKQYIHLKDLSFCK